MLSARYSKEPPVVPVGVDAYRLWDRWHIQQIGVRAFMESTRDRTGGNRTACASHFYYQESEDFSVALHVEGKGVLYFHRANCWHGSPWHYEVDGVDHVVCETATADPQHWLDNHRYDENAPECVFDPQEIFCEPLAWNWRKTRGADLIWVPVGFEQSFRLAYGRTRYGTGYFIYKQYAGGIPLSREIVPFDGKTPPESEALDVLRRAGADIAPAEGVDGTVKQAGTLDLNTSLSKEFLAINGEFLIRALQFSVPEESAVDFGNVRLQVTWDGRDEPSIDAPLSLFFGAGTLYNPDKSEFLIPRMLTEGKEEIRLKLVHVPDERELWPGRPFPEKSAWSEIGYRACCFVMPMPGKETGD